MKRKRYSTDLTNMILEGKAGEVYCNTEPLEIYEEKVLDGYLYDVEGVVEQYSLTEDELIELLEELGGADQ